MTLFRKFKKKHKTKARVVKKREHSGSAKGKDPREEFFKPGGPYSKGKRTSQRFK